MKARRMIAAILSVLMVFGVFQISASAAGRTPFGFIIQYETNGDTTAENNFVKKHEGVLEALFKGCIDYEESIDIHEYQIPVGDFDTLLFALLDIYPELFFVDGANYSYANGKVYDFYPSYSVTKDDAEVMLGEFYDKADEYLALIKDGMDEFTKALVLHDALVLNSEYCIDKTVDDVYVYSSNYTFMVEGWGRCENYAECYAYLLAQIGIESEIIDSYPADPTYAHEWMKIQLDDSTYYYNVDVTWDDPVYTGIGDVPYKVSHNNFLISDNMITDNNSHSNYTEIIVSDDAYDGYTTLHSHKNPFFYTNGTLYTLYVDGYTGYIATYDHEEDSFTKVYEITDKWSAGPWSTWNGNFSGIAMDKGMLYYNGDNCVYCYNPENGVRTVYIEEALTDGRHLYGLYIKDGKIYGKAAANPNTTDFEYVCLGEVMQPNAVVVADYIQNGTVTADKESALAGETVTLTVNPDKGYDVESVYVNNDEIQPIGGIYSFTMPMGEAIVTASFMVGEPLAGHSISLNGDIGLNFYYNLTEAQAEDQKVTFTWKVDGKDKTAECKLKEDDKTRYYKASCPIPAAEMTAEVTATLAIGDLTITDKFSVVEYANYILSEDYQNIYLGENPAQEKLSKYDALATLVKTMLYYGAMAQIRFERDTDNLANDGVDYTPGEVDTDSIVDSSDMYTGLGDYGLEYKGTTVVFLSQSSLRHYYKITGDDFDSVKNDITFGGSTIEIGEKDDRIYFELKNIAAADLDTQYTLKIGNSEYNYSALDYVKACLLYEGYGPEDEAHWQKMKNLAAATYLYNQAANAYFG